MFWTEEIIIGYFVRGLLEGQEDIPEKDKNAKRGTK